ncbi:hypothetical protein [Fonticella tunisiensis]|uniref:Uncharacterized protein n=1 Tax=Fonticella tunisiensis TaxID=1096341 RepID=A0A4R7KTG8_9CLOT|nr:hypothetical protein [Fonticella tunisiensis]TDT63398.1 hypothetical protein EDD71_102160 [Fonticella tunisiensis]
MPQQGWICLYRKISDSWLWDDRPFSKGQAWIDLILLANHEDRKILLGNELITIPRGSFITSELKLMKRWGWSKEKVRNFLKLLQDDGMIVKISDKKKTTINIVNYSIYQDMPDHKQTTERPQKDQEQTTSRLPADTNNNDNNYNNDNKDINNMCVTPAEKPEEGGAQENNPGKGEYTEDFERFWSLYPRRKEKIRAFKAWKARLKEKVNPEELIKAASNYAMYCKLNHTEERYIKHASTFLGPDKPFMEYIEWHPEHEVSVTADAFKGQKKNIFRDYGGQRQYDVQELKKQLLGRSGHD